MPRRDDRRPAGRHLPGEPHTLPAPSHLPLRVTDIRLLERPVPLRLPFRYGSVTLREASQAFVRAHVETGAGAAWGVAAELLAPRWFDKDPRLSDAQTVQQLRRALFLARPCYLDREPAPAFALAVDALEQVVVAGRDAGLPPLAAAFGPALIDRAVLDAACRASSVSFFDAVRANLPGLDAARAAPDLDGFDLAGFLASLSPLRQVEARHTVGLLDPLADGSAGADAVDDGLPVSLEAVIARYRPRWFKLKAGGDADADLARLAAVAAVLDRGTGGAYRVTLDGNEQYHGVPAFADFLARLRAHPALSRLRDAIAFVEQPLAREIALEREVSAITALYPAIIDESDDGYPAFPRARALGYAGVSSKQCKGLYKAIVNAARCTRWNAAGGAPRAFLSGEDLSCQGGVSVQQDLALASLLGIRHVERNGHHFAGATPGASPAEHRALLTAHPDLYVDVGRRAALRIRDGVIETGSLSGPGFAHSTDPDPATMSPMEQPPG